MPNERILIFSGGVLGNWALDEVGKDDFLIGADRGSLFLLQNNLQPDFVIGDFDSLTDEEFRLVQESCHDLISCDPVCKDYTDTEMAFNWALQKKPDEIILLGVTGTRIDHTLANIQLLRRGLSEGVLSRIIDENNEIALINKSTRLTKGRFTHVSLLPLTTYVTGVTLEGFQYPLEDATLCMGTTLAISNVILPNAEAGEISVKTGELLVIQARD